jgi:hypothetical protein
VAPESSPQIDPVPGPSPEHVVHVELRALTERLSALSTLLDAAALDGTLGDGLIVMSLDAASQAVHLALCELRYCLLPDCLLPERPSSPSWRPVLDPVGGRDRLAG